MLTFHGDAKLEIRWTCGGSCYQTRIRFPMTVDVDGTESERDAIREAVANLSPQELVRELVQCIPWVVKEPGPVEITQWWMVGDPEPPEPKRPITQPAKPKAQKKKTKPMEKTKHVNYRDLGKKIAMGGWGRNYTGELEHTIQALLGSADIAAISVLAHMVEQLEATRKTNEAVLRAIKALPDKMATVEAKSAAKAAVQIEREKQKTARAQEKANAALAAVPVVLQMGNDELDRLPGVRQQF